MLHRRESSLERRLPIDRLLEARGMGRLRRKPIASGNALGNDRGNRKVEEERPMLRRLGMVVDPRRGGGRGEVAGHSKVIYVGPFGKARARLLVAERAT